MSNSGTVIIGAGQAGGQLAVSLRESGYENPVTLIGDEEAYPYHRPPLSKDFLAGKIGVGELEMRSPRFYEERRITVRAGVRVERIDRADKSVQLANGEKLQYDKLVLATGTSPRRLPVDNRATNVHYLRTIQDACRLKAEVANAKKVLVIGAGFIGLEFASVATKLGAEVSVVEAGERIMGRAASPELSEIITARHQADGVNILTHTQVEEFHYDSQGSIESVRLSGKKIEFDLVVVGIGVVPNTEIAADAGIAIDNGIVVNEQLATNAPDIFAIGDVANFVEPRTGKPVRLESVQNATDQARYLAEHIAGSKNTPYNLLPWFWSHQAGVKIQIAGTSVKSDHAVIIGDVTAGSFSIYRLSDGVVKAVESVNASGDHLAVRRILSSGIELTEEQLQDENFSVRNFAKQLVKAA